MSASNVTKAAWIHVIRVHDTTHLSVTTLRSSKRSRTTPHKERLERTKHFLSLHVMKQTRINWENKTPNKRQTP